MQTANIKTFHRKVVIANSVIKELCRQSTSLMFKVFVKINIITEVMASIALQIYQKFIINFKKQTAPPPQLWNILLKLS